MKRPSFQFYPADWMSDLKLRRCSPAARGVWMDILCALHDSDDGYGLLRWPLKDIASTVGASMSHVRELAEKGVLRGSDTMLDEPMVYTPRSGRKDGDPVTLVQAGPGPVWYSQRMVKDEYVRTIRGESSRFGAAEDGSPKPTPKPPFGDGTTSSSSSSSSHPPSEDVGARKRGSKKCPADFAVGMDLLAWAAANTPAVNVEAETAKFRDHTFGRSITDWDGTWRNWMRKASELAPKASVVRHPAANKQLALEAENERARQQWLREQA